MRLGIVTTQTPFIVGGAERHAANLVHALKSRGFEACEITVPFKPYPGRTLVDSLLAAKLVDLSELGYPVDMAVGLKFPAYLARHPHKVYWVLHQHRQVYDLWEAGTSELMADPDGLAVRELIRAEDRAAFTAEGVRLYANSDNVAHRMRRHLDVAATPLYHPPPNAGRLRADSHGDYLFAPSRLGPSKRQTLMIEALAHAGRHVRLKIAGPPDVPGYAERLRRLAAERGVAERVEVLGPISDDEMIRLYAGARGVVFVPVDEDYGYITLEAMLSHRPVITATDAGGPLEFVRDGIEGLVSAPEPAALGAAFTRLFEDRGAAEAMGARAFETYGAKGISWDAVVETLTAGARPVAPDAAGAMAAPSVAEEVPRAETGEGRSDGAAPAPDPVARLAAAVAAPVPAGTPFADLDALLQAYEFGTWPGYWQARAATARPYLASHWRRFLATLALLDRVPAAEDAPERLLDIGISPPFVFQALLAAHRGTAGIDGIWDEDHPHAQTVQPTGGGTPLTVRLHPADVERDPLPLADGAHDVVLAMEVLEHLAVDPTFFLAEANRVLADGGHLVLTTPNAASHRGVAKILAGASPQSFGLFVPVGGVHGRHNREYAPREVAALAGAAGFETLSLATADVYDTDIDPGVAALLAGRGDDLGLRGETILYLGRKAGLPGAAPEGLFHGRPEQLSGRLSLAAREGARVRLRVENTSRSIWAATGPFAVVLGLDWIDHRGRLVHPGGQVALPRALAPGEALEMALATGDPGAADGRLRVTLFEDGAGPMSGTGRAAPLVLACPEAAFLRMVRP